MTDTGMDPAAQLRLAAWTRTVRAGLKSLPQTDADEIVRELSSHALDRAAEMGGLTGANLEAALAALGRPQDLAGLYLAERMAERVETDRSPLRVLRAAFNLAGLSVDAFFVFMGSLLGYALGVGLILVAVLKPIFPAKVGFWRLDDPNDLSVSIGMANNPHGHDIMGWWIIPFGLLLGAVVTFLAWRFSLAGVRRLGRARARLFAPKG